MVLTAFSKNGSYITLLLAHLIAILASQTFHENLNKFERMNMFGVENVSDVPDYKFVRINKTKLDDGRLKLNFFAWGSEYILMLSPNLHLVSPDLTSVIRDHNGTHIYNGLPPGIKMEQCNYIGDVVSHVGASAAISDCGDITGTIITENETLILVAIPKRFQIFGIEILYKSNRIHQTLGKTENDKANDSVNQAKAKANGYRRSRRLAKTPFQHASPQKIHSWQNPHQIFFDVFSGAVIGKKSNAYSWPNAYLQPNIYSHPNIYSYPNVYPLPNSYSQSNIHLPSNLQSPNIHSNVQPPSVQAPNIYSLPNVQPPNIHSAPSVQAPNIYSPPNIHSPSIHSSPIHLNKFGQLLTIELAVFVDLQFFSLFEYVFQTDVFAHLYNYSLAYVNNVAYLFANSYLNVHLVITHFELWRTQRHYINSTWLERENAEIFHEAFSKYQQNINPGSKIANADHHYLIHWDHAVLLTGYDLHIDWIGGVKKDLIVEELPMDGDPLAKSVKLKKKFLAKGKDYNHILRKRVDSYSKFGKICDQLYSTSVVRATNLGTSHHFAHALGYNLGLTLDGKENICRDVGIMSPESLTRKNTWSTCSISEFHHIIERMNSVKGNCLMDQAYWSLYNENRIMPGHRFSADEQCMLYHGKQYKMVLRPGKNISTICERLTCGGIGLRVKYAGSAATGTLCGHKMYCFYNRCVRWPFRDNPEPVEGQWTKWDRANHYKADSKCVIAGSIPIAIQKKQCIMHASNNSLPCVGISKRGITLDKPISTCKGKPRKIYADSVCRNKAKAKKHLNLTGSSTFYDEERCEVWCKIKATYHLFQAGLFPDGSPCGQNKYCVDGHCMRLACNNTLLVDEENKEDCPLAKELPIPQWSKWTEWSPCSTTCGPGTQSRLKRCGGPGGGNCPVKDEEEIRYCKFTRACPTTTTVPHPSIPSPWAEWSQCPVTCGISFQARMRKCHQDHCVPIDIRFCTPELPRCPKEATQRPEIKNEIDIWTTWSTCSVTCGAHGFQQRIRICDEKICGSIVRPCVPKPSQCSQEKSVSKKSTTILPKLTTSATLPVLIDWPCARITPPYSQEKSVSKKSTTILPKLTTSATLPVLIDWPCARITPRYSQEKNVSIKSTATLSKLTPTPTLPKLTTTASLPVLINWPCARITPRYSQEKNVSKKPIAILSKLTPTPTLPKLTTTTTFPKLVDRPCARITSQYSQEKSVSKKSTTTLSKLITTPTLPKFTDWPCARTTPRYSQENVSKKSSAALLMVTTAKTFTTRTKITTIGILRKLTTTGTLRKVTTTGMLRKLTTTGTLRKLATTGTLRKLTTTGTLRKLTTTGTLRKLTTTGTLRKLATIGTSRKLTTVEILPKLITNTSSSKPTTITASSIPGMWSEWSHCSVTCGRGGTQERRRTCRQEPCKRRETRFCVSEVVDCAGLDSYSAWSEWSTCSVTCGKGIKSRNRECFLHTELCTAHITESMVCGDGPC